ncbi:MAG: glycosyltransferase family 4 protein [Chloroflexi bacterium]|nr:glycosyltransferase family 4 protein [Chloroflexota bacterium]
MHILLIADGRSPTTRTYLRTLYALGLQVSLLSTFPCSEPDGLKSFELMPVALARFAGSQASAVNTSSRIAGGADKKSFVRKIASFSRKVAAPARYVAGPLSIAFYKNQYLDTLKRINPDIVHALRIPYEGMLAACIPAGIPLIISMWGNDLTLHAHGSLLMKNLTRKTLQRADGLIADTRRDIRLAREWGYSEDKPVLVIPGSGGLDLQAVDQANQAVANLSEKLLKASRLVVNPRGFRPGSVRNDTFFAAIPLVLKQLPDTLFACCAMQGQPEALAWVERLKIHNEVVLLPYLPQEETWALFHIAQVSVSISQHDGTPNSLLEAMACGCFPIAGDIESLREWIQPGQNGLLVNPADPQELAEALVEALTHEELRKNAARINREIVETRAEKRFVQAQIDEFYHIMENPANRLSDR